LLRVNPESIKESKRATKTVEKSPRKPLIFGKHEYSDNYMVVTSYLKVIISFACISARVSVRASSLRRPCSKYLW
jgi:hypothetical protein